MKVERTYFNGLLILEPHVFKDDRGFLMESYNKLVLENHGISVAFVQENHSHSEKNVIRGLHFQKQPYEQVKLVRVIYGAILDVVVDLRKSEPTFSKVHTVELSAENRKQLFIPRGFAHGFSVLTETAGVLYKCDNHYHREVEGGLLYSDPALEINWKVKIENALVSEKDLALPKLADLQYSF